MFTTLQSTLIVTEVTSLIPSTTSSSSSEGSDGGGDQDLVSTTCPSDEEDKTSSLSEILSDHPTDQQGREGLLEGSCDFESST